MKNTTKTICTFIFLSMLVIPAIGLSQDSYSSHVTETFNGCYFAVPHLDDYDPTVEQINVTFTVQEIRALDTMDLLSPPDFYVKVSINGHSFKSNVWRGMKYIEEPN